MMCTLGQSCPETTTAIQALPVITQLCILFQSELHVVLPLPYQVGAAGATLFHYVVSEPMPVEHAIFTSSCHFCSPKMPV
jgi:hypothetical protein